MPSPQTLVAALSAAVLLVALSGCSLRITDPDSGERRASESSAAIETDDQDTGRDGGDAHVSAEDPDDIRARIAQLTTTTLTCDGERTITQMAVKVRIEGRCEVLVLEMGGGTFLADDIGELRIAGMGNTVYADAIGRVIVDGGGNTVRWRGATPDIDVDGLGNSLQAG